MCIGDYTKVLRKKVQCPYCEYQACSACIQQYLLSTPETPHCMSCRKSWSRHFLSTSFTSKFMNEQYKEHRENMLFELEKSLMPSTQSSVERVIYERKCNREIASHMTTILLLNDELSHMYVDSVEVKEATCDLRRRIFDLQLKVEVLQYKIANRVRNTEKRQFVRACPADECKGFLSTQWKCGLCEQYTCKECHEIKKDGHECKPENIETAKLLARDTKTCPSCAALIHKIDGCDQMFCTSCHTAFSWRTGKIETGRIHNPHYYDYQRLRGVNRREIGDIQCGGMPTYNQISHVIGRAYWISTLHRNITHFEHVDMNRYRNINITNPNRNLELRILYMLNELSEAGFKKRIQQIDKDLNKRLEIGQVSTTFIQVMSDLFTRLVNDRNIDAFSSEYKEAAKYFNNLFYAISESYNCTVPYIFTATNEVIMLNPKRLHEVLEQGAK